MPITPKYFFRLNKSLHLFETHCAFLPFFNPNFDLLQAVKVTKSDRHLSHDQASKGYGSIPCLTSQTSLHACLQRLRARSFGIFRNKNIFRNIFWLFCSEGQNSRNGNPGVPE